MSDFYSALSHSMDEQEQIKLGKKLMELLSLRVQLYTMSDSSSVPTEIAELLLKSLCFTLGISAESTPSELCRLANSDLSGEFDRGILRLAKKVAYGRDLWQHICLNMPPVCSVSMNDTLKSIGQFWRKYDYRFFACEIPCDIDYQLSFPVADELIGIDYVNCYLERLYTENSFLSRFDRDALLPVMQSYCRDYDTLLVNLFEPAAANAIGLALLDKPFQCLKIGDNELSMLYRKFNGAESRDIHKMLCTAVSKIVGENDVQAQYLNVYCGSLAPRIAAVSDFGGLGGIFFRIP